MQRIVAAAEAIFAKHGDKALRANCGNKLAHDETYGFVLVDMKTGCLAPRDDAIKLGEKLRKINASVRDKLSGPKGFAKAESRKLSKAKSDEERQAIVAV